MLEDTIKQLFSSELSNLSKQDLVAMMLQMQQQMNTLTEKLAIAMIYSLVETAEVNDLKIYEYLNHLLTEILKHMEDTSLDFVENLLPWSEALPQNCSKTK